MTHPRSPLIDAAGRGDVAGVRDLLAAGADPNERQVHEDHVDRFTMVDFVVTPLLAALRNGRSEVALLLLERGASIDERDAYDGHTPLTIAARRDLVEVVRAIVARRPPDLREQLDAALVCACGGDPASSSIVAVRDDSVGVAMVEYLLSVGARAPRALYLACFYGRLDLAARLADAGMPVDRADADAPLLAAAGQGRLDVLDWLLARGADLRAIGGEALAFATHARQRAMVLRLLDLGADVDAIGRWGWTPLFYAASSGNAEMVELLLERGADREHRDEQGKTALGWAQQHPAVVSLLAR